MKTLVTAMKSVIAFGCIAFMLSFGKLLFFNWFSSACKTIGAGIPIFIAVIYLIVLIIVVVVLFDWIFPSPDCHGHKKSGDFNKIVITYKEDTDVNGKKVIEGEVKLVPQEDDARGGERV